MKKRESLPLAAELLEEDNSPNVTKRKLVIDITNELAAEAADRAAAAAAAAAAATAAAEAAAAATQAAGVPDGAVPTGDGAPPAVEVHPVVEERVPTQLEVFAIVQKLLEHISKAVAENKKIELRNFGVFEVKIRKARVGRNPNKPEVDVPIPQRAVVKFKAGKEMRLAVLKLTPPPPAAKKPVAKPTAKPNAKPAAAKIPTAKKATKAAAKK